MYFTRETAQEIGAVISDWTNGAAPSGEHTAAFITEAACWNCLTWRLVVFSDKIKARYDGS